MKKLIAIITAAVLIAVSLPGCLCGCGGQDAGGGIISDGQTGSAVSQASAAAVTEHDPGSYLQITAEQYSPNAASSDVRLRVEATDLNGHTAWRKIFGPSAYFDDRPSIETLDLVYYNMIFLNVQELRADAVTEDYTVTENGLYALDRHTGDVVWHNSDFTGAGCRDVFDSANRALYISCGYGPCCFAVDMDGNTLWAVEKAPDDNRYPHSIEIDQERDCIKITYGDIDVGEDTEYIYISYDGTVMG